MLRSYKTNIRKNWSLSAKEWNDFFLYLSLDMIDIYNELDVFSESYQFLFDTTEDISPFINNNPFGMADKL